MTEERLPSKFTFILHADVASSTALVRQDEELAHKRIQDSFRRFGEIIARYSGYVRELRGDALLAEFDRASDAVTAALAFQAGQTEYLSQLDDSLQPKVRVGIAMGEVIVADNTLTGAGVVLAQRMEQLARQGGICITGAIHEALPQRLPFHQESMGEQDIKGFDEAVRVYRVELESEASIPPPQTRMSTEVSPKIRMPVAVTAATVIAVLIAAGGAAYWLGQRASKEESASIEHTVVPSRDKPTIAVLPFDNLSEDSDQEYFSDGISEDIITDLSQISSLGVVSRNSSFAYKDTTVNIKDIASELGVGYVLEGSVRKVDDRVRVTAQLINATTGHHIWADRYDRQLRDVFELQDEIRLKIVSALSIQLLGEEAANLSRKPTNSFEAYDLFLKARPFFSEYTVEGLDQATTLYRRAIELDPEFARAYGALAIAMTRQVNFLAPDLINDRLNQTLEVVKQAVTIEPTSPQVQWALGYVLMYRGELEKAAQAVEESVTLSPNYADGWGLLALVNNNLGRGDQALRFIRKASELNPRFTWEYPWNEGKAYYNMGEYHQAVAPLTEALSRNENALLPRLYLAACYLRLGQTEDAEWEITQAEVINPELSIKQLEHLQPMSEGDHRDRFFEDMKILGLSD